MRINVIPVKLLADQHLIAEYNEASEMMLTYYRRSVLQRKSPFDKSEIPANYTLNKGHAMFFYDKMLGVYNRWHEVRAECENRGFTTNIMDLDYSIVKPEHMNDWKPSKRDMIVNLERIQTRISQKPHWYRYYGKPIEKWDAFYFELNQELNSDILKRI